MKGLYLAIVFALLVLAFSHHANAYSIVVEVNESAHTKLVDMAASLEDTGRDLPPGYWVSVTVEAKTEHRWAVIHRFEGGAVGLGPYVVALEGDWGTAHVGIRVFLNVYKNGHRVYSRQIGYVGPLDDGRWSISFEAWRDCQGAVYIRVYSPEGGVAYTDSSSYTGPVRVLASGHYKINDVRRYDSCSSATSTTTSMPAPWDAPPITRPAPSPNNDTTIALGAGAVGLAGAAAYVIARRR